LAKEIEDLKNDAERIKAEGTKNLQVKSQQIALLNERISEIEKERKGKNDQIAKLEKELTNAKNQKTPPKSIIQPATKRIHIVYILSILALACVSLFLIVKEMRSNLNLKELLQADELELASYRQTQQAVESYQLGEDYYYGRNGKTQNYEEAVRCYRKAAELGYARAQNDLGVMYANGRGVTKNDEEAVKWYRKAAEQGNATAQYNLGVMYANGRGVTKDDEEAVKWFRKAAEQGSADAQCYLGYMYGNGRGVTKDYEEAVKWYRKAAEQGNEYGQYNLGYMYEKGLGVTKSDEEAVKWYRKAAEQGYENAKKALERLGK